MIRVTHVCVLNDGVDKRQQPMYNRLNPYLEDQFDGFNINPLEVLFVKVKVCFAVNTMLRMAYIAPTL